MVLNCDIVSHGSLLAAARTRSTFSGVLLVAGLPGCGSLWTDSWPSLKHLCHAFLCCTHCIVPESLLNHPNSFRGGMLKFNAKFDANSLLYLLSHFECDDDTAHMLTQLRLSPHPHWPVQWSRHYSCMRIPVHSPWLPGYTSVAQTVLVICTKVGLFLDRLHIYYSTFLKFG